MNYELTHVGLLLPYNLFNAKQLKIIQSKFTQKFFREIGPPIVAKNYDIMKYASTKYLRLPRTSYIAFSKNFKINVNLPQPKYVDKINENQNFQLHDNQKIIVDYLMQNIYTLERINNATASCILNLRAGMGKTFVAAGLITKLKMRTLYIVPKRPLAEQALKDLRVCFPQLVINLFHKNPKKKDKSTEYKNQDITIIVIDSALLRDSDFFKDYSFVIYDEVHSYCSNKRKQIFKQMYARCCFGMTATSNDRTDNLDIIVHKELTFKCDNGVIFAENIPNFTYDSINFDCDVELLYYNVKNNYYSTPILNQQSKVDFLSTIKRILEDPDRMKLVINKLRELYDWVGPNNEKHNIYVFCELRDPLKDLYYEFIKHFDDVNAPEVKNDVKKFIGGIKKDEINEAKSARVLLSTYSYAGTGVSIDKMTAIVFLTPRKANMKQIIARILRRGGDTSIKRRIIDIVDSKSALRNQVYQRKKSYEFYSANIIKKKC